MYYHNLTVAQLKDLLGQYPDDTKVFFVDTYGNEQNFCQIELDSVLNQQLKIALR